jgi:hypothetical protein
METIRLTGVENVEHPHGMDLLGREWVQCWTIGLSYLKTLRCAYCNVLIERDEELWICAENGEIRCGDHIDCRPQTLKNRLARRRPLEMFYAV